MSQHDKRTTQQYATRAKNGYLAWWLKADAAQCKAQRAQQRRKR